jgi:hypothetical protein
MAIDRHEVNREASVAKVSIIERYHMTSTDLLPQKQLWHIDWLVSAKYVGELRPQEPCYFWCITDMPLQSSQHHSACMTSTTITERLFLPTNTSCTDRDTNVLRVWLSIGIVCIPQSFGRKRALFCAVRVCLQRSLSSWLLTLQRNAFALDGDACLEN